MPSTITLDGVALPNPGFGAMGLSAFYGETDLEQSKATLRKTLEIGCTVWNTADMYGKGANEELIGSVLSEPGVDRSKVFLITKFGNRWTDIEKSGKLGGTLGGFVVDGSKEYAAEAIDASIKRMNGITPDVWVVHRIDKTVPIEETVLAMEEARKAGKTKYIGLSECSAATLRKAAAVPGAKIDFIEVEYSPWTTTMEDNGVLAAASELGVIVLAYSPLGRGFLTGKYSSVEDFGPDNAFRAGLPRMQKDTWDANYKLVEAFEKIAKAKNCTTGQLSLAWLMAQPGQILPIPGTKREHYLIENFAARDVRLTMSDLAEIRSAINANKPVGERYRLDNLFPSRLVYALAFLPILIFLGLNNIFPQSIQRALGRLSTYLPAFLTVPTHSQAGSMSTAASTTPSIVLSTREEWSKELDRLPSLEATGGAIPSIFLAHGQPFLVYPPALAAQRSGFEALRATQGPDGTLANFLKDLGPVLLEKYKPKAIVVFSAHWETPNERLVTDYGAENPLLMDYFGFPDELYQLKFESSGDHAISERVVELFKAVGTKARLSSKLEPRGEDGRGHQGPGLDHGVFVPFKLMFGDKSPIPIIQVSIDSSLSPEKEWAIGAALAPLRSEGILLISGGLTIHTFRDFGAFAPATTKPVFKDFEESILDAVAVPEPAKRKQALINLTSHPGFRSAHPREEHFVPLYVAAGAASDGDARSPSPRYTFVDVLYKYSEFQAYTFPDLKSGLEYFVNLYFEDTHSAAARKKMLASSDEALVQTLFRHGRTLRDNQAGSGLVAIIEGSREACFDSQHTVYLEMYYKHGEYSLSEGYNDCLETALKALQAEWQEKDEWEEWDEEDKWELAMAQSKQDVAEQKGWGVVRAWEGRLLWSTPCYK
ncbi:hypothetical protein RQP46_008734 [Phenoliferia psychrophenolica]